MNFVARSYQLLALLDVCEIAARHMQEDSSRASRDAGSLADTLKLASEIAGEVHDALELAEEPEQAA